MLSLCIGGISASGDDDHTLTLKPAVYSDYKASIIGAVIKLLLICGTLYYGIWFVYVGMDTMIFTPCSTSAFWFAKLVGKL